MSNCDWKDSNEYQRIQEILEDYWLSVPDEAQVTVCMTFRKANGEEQSKRIVWENPKYKNVRTQLRNLHQLSGDTQSKCSCF